MKQTTAHPILPLVSLVCLAAPEHAGVSGPECRGQAVVRGVLEVCQHAVELSMGQDAAAHEGGMVALSCLQGTIVMGFGHQ